MDNYQLQHSHNDFSERLQVIVTFNSFVSTVVYSIYKAISKKVTITVVFLEEVFPHTCITIYICVLEFLCIRHFTSHNLDESCRNVIVSVSKAINTLHGGRSEATLFAAQKSLADFTGMIHRGYLLHLTVTDSLMDNRNNVGNKIAILGGDYFISKACLGLASLQNTHVSMTYAIYM